MKTIDEEIVQEALGRQPHPLLFAVVSGSHLYGFASRDSDLDLRGAHMLPLDRVVGLDSGPETIEFDEEIGGVEVDLVTHDIGKYFGMLVGRSGNVLEHVSSPHVQHSTEGFDELRRLVPDLLVRNHGRAYRGYAASVWESFCDEPKLKPLLYVFRVLLTGLHLMETGQIEANLEVLADRWDVSFVDGLIERKRRGTEHQRLPDPDLTVWTERYERLVDRLEQARRATDLPRRPVARPELHELLVDLRLEYAQWGDCRDDAFANNPG